MTVSVDTNKQVYTANGSQTDFETIYKVFDHDDILVQTLTVAGILSTKVIDVDYTVASDINVALPRAATITFITAPASGVKVILRRNQPKLQETDYIENENFPAQTHENNLDKLVMMVQEHEEILARTIRLNPDQDISSVLLPGLSANGDKVLAVNSAGTALEWTTAGEIVLSDSIHDLTADTIVAADEIAFYDASGAEANKTTFTNFEAALTVENQTGGTSTGTGNLVRAVGPTMTLPNATGLPINTGVSGLGTGIAAALAINTGSAGAPVLFNGAGGTPSSLVGTNISGTAAALTAGTVTTNANLTGHITSVGNAAVLGSFTVAQLNTALSDGDIASGGGTATGTNTGDQTITLTGDVTGTGTGTFAATIANDAVTYAKMQNVSATDKILGRSTSGSGDVEEIACTAAGRALIDDADASAQRTTLGLGTLATQSGTFSGTSSGTNTGDQTITLTGGVTGSGTGSFAATVVTNANLTGHITSTGNAAVLGSFTSAQLAAALTDETGSGANVHAISPALVTPALGDATGTKLNIDNVQIDGNTILATDTNGNLNLGPNGTGQVILNTGTTPGQTALGRTGVGVADTTAGVSIDPANYIAIHKSSTGAGTALYIKRLSAAGDGTLIEFATNGGTQGSISVSGGTVAYNTFTGGHWSQLSDNTNPVIPSGTIVETINERCHWSGESDSPQLAKFKISDTKGSKAIYGVFNHWDLEGDANIYALGTAMVRLTGECQVGDLLESNGDGTAVVQEDDIIRSSTLGKVTCSTKTEDGKVSAVLYCG